MATIYFRTNGSNPSWNDPTRWYLDANLTTPYSMVPQTGDIVNIGSTGFETMAIGPTASVLLSEVNIFGGGQYFGQNINFSLISASLFNLVTGSAPQYLEKFYTILGELHADEIVIGGRNRTFETELYGNVTLHQTASIESDVFGNLTLYGQSRLQGFDDGYTVTGDANVYDDARIDAGKVNGIAKFHSITGTTDFYVSEYVGMFAFRVSGSVNAEDEPFTTVIVGATYEEQGVYADVGLDVNFQNGYCYIGQSGTSSFINNSVLTLHDGENNYNNIIFNGTSHTQVNSGYNNKWITSPNQIRFEGESYNTAKLASTNVLFTDNSLNEYVSDMTATTGSIYTFNDEAINEAIIESASFYGNSENNGTIEYDGHFYEFSRNNENIIGNMFMNDSSTNVGSVDGNLILGGTGTDVSITNPNQMGGIVSGDILNENEDVITEIIISVYTDSQFAKAESVIVRDGALFNSGNIYGTLYIEDSAAVNASVYGDVHLVDQFRTNFGYMSEGYGLYLDYENTTELTLDDEYIQNQFPPLLFNANSDPITKIIFDNESTNNTSQQLSLDIEFSNASANYSSIEANTITFKDTSYNLSNLTGLVIFTDSLNNQGDITGDVKLTYVSGSDMSLIDSQQLRQIEGLYLNSIDEEITRFSFSNSTYNYANISSASFFDSSNNQGDVTKADFFNTSQNQGYISTASFHNESTANGEFDYVSFYDNTYFNNIYVYQNMNTYDSSSGEYPYIEDSTASFHDNTEVSYIQGNGQLFFKDNSKILNWNSAGEFSYIRFENKNALTASLQNIFGSDVVKIPVGGINGSSILGTL